MLNQHEAAASAGARRRVDESLKISFAQKISCYSCRCSGQEHLKKETTTWLLIQQYILTFKNIIFQNGPILLCGLKYTPYYYFTPK